MTDVFVCGDGELADNAVRIVRIGELEIGVIHRGNQYYAYHNVCPHQGGPACEGIMMPQVEEIIESDGTSSGQRFDHDDMHIVCPWHGYEFHLTSGVHVRDSRYRLRKYAVRIEDGKVYVEI
jgi:nitrite reductase (NADH) small subunit